MPFPISKSVASCFIVVPTCTVHHRYLGESAQIFLATFYDANRIYPEIINHEHNTNIIIYMVGRLTRDSFWNSSSLTALILSAQSLSFSRSETSNCCITNCCASIRDFTSVHRKEIEKYFQINLQACNNQGMARQADKGHQIFTKNSTIRSF